MKHNLVVFAALGLLAAPAGVALADPTIHSFLGPELPMSAQGTYFAQDSEKDRRQTAQREAAEDAKFTGTAVRKPADDKLKPHRIPERLIDVNP
jgi:hypothetical protein